jgi:hypothetical protein
MDVQAFRQFLKRSGRTEAVTDEVVAAVQAFAAFLEEHCYCSLDEAAEADLDSFVAWIERAPEASARGYLWAIRYYYQFSRDLSMEKHASGLREARVLRKPLPLKDFRGVEPDHLARLAGAGVKNAEQMLAAAGSPEDRTELALETGIPEATLQELASLSDLAQLPGVKGIRARLYYDAGIHSVQALAEWDAEALLQMLVEFVERTGFEGIPPLPKEVRSTIENARRMARSSSSKKYPQTGRLREK